MAVTTLVLRPMTGDDVQAVLGLERSIFPDPWPEVFFRDELAAPRRCYLVAEEDGEVIGYGGVMLVDEDAHITNLAVAEPPSTSLWRCGSATSMPGGCTPGSGSPRWPCTGTSTPMRMH